MNWACRPRFGFFLRALFVLAGASAFFVDANALPAFSVQTGETCARCHTSAFGPSLTAYGREFKLNGYGQGEYNYVPLSMTALGSYAHLREDPPAPPLPDLRINDNAVLNEATLYAASRITSRSGGYMSATYDRFEERTRWGNLDVRYAFPWLINDKLYLLVGATVNNNPTIQDLWNSAPARAYPFIQSDLLPSSVTAPVIEGALSQKVLGTSVYGMLNNHYYLEVGFYKGLSDHWLDKMGMDTSDSLHTSDLIPYWRAVATRSFGRHHFSLGLLGLTVKTKPDPTLPNTDKYTDQGIDATYEFIDKNNNSLNVNVSAIKEHRDQSASFWASETALQYNDIYSRRIDATYAYDQTMVGSAGWFDIKGNSDPLAWQPIPYTGSATGEPDTRGYTVQLEYIPFGKTTSPVNRHFNLRFGFRYTIYKRFNGGTDDYDGSGRNATDNESILGYARVAF